MASTKTLPNFFIVGHPKSGTTALYEMLRSHPEIYMPDEKEPQFFTTEKQLYRFTPLLSLDGYLSLFSDARSDQRAGEASVLYLWSDMAARRIAQVQPAARIISIIREPTSFLRSLHLQYVQGHLEYETDFRKALALEEDRRNGVHDPRSLACSPEMLVYSDYVRYVDQLRRYQAEFPAHQMMTIVYDDFRSDGEGSTRAVLRFLGVDGSAPLPSVEANPTVRVRYPGLNRAVRSVYKGQSRISRVAKSGIKAVVPSTRLRRMAIEKTQQQLIYGQPREPDEQLTRELRERFKPEIVALSEYLDRDLVTQWGYDAVPSR